MTINAWVLLLGAIALEVASTSLLNASQGMTRWGYGIAAMAGYGVCFWLLAFAMTRIPMGVAYAVWSGVGIVLIATVAWIFQGQKLDAPAILGMGLIISGVVVMNLFSKAAAH